MYQDFDPSDIQKVLSFMKIIIILTFFFIILKWGHIFLAHFFSTSPATALESTGMHSLSALASSFL